MARESASTSHARVRPSGDQVGTLTHWGPAISATRRTTPSPPTPSSTYTPPSARIATWVPSGDQAGAFTPCREASRHVLPSATETS